MNDIIEKIESLEFCAICNIASSYNVFFRIATEEEGVFLRLCECLKDNKENANIIKERICQISKEDFDRNFSHPKDTALFVYLLSLSECEYNIGLELDRVNDIPNLWWAKKLCFKLMNPPMFDKWPGMPL